MVAQKVVDGGGLRLDYMLLLVSWATWKERNPRVFESSARLPAQIYTNIVTEGNVWIITGFSNLKVLLSLSRA